CEHVPHENRAHAMIVAANLLRGEGQDELAHSLATKPAFQLVREDIRADYDRARNALAQAARGGDAWETSALAALAAKPLDRFSITVLDRFIRQLTFADNHERAKALIAAAKDVT